MNFQTNEVFNKFAAVIKSRIVNEPSSCYLLHDNEIDITILKHGILENDRNLLYVVRPSERVCCVVTNISIRNIIFVAVEIISHSYMSILIYIVVKLKKSHGSKQTICCLVQENPH